MLYYSAQSLNKLDNIKRTELKAVVNVQLSGSVNIIN